MTLGQQDTPPLKKFQNPQVTAKGEVRARVALRALDTLWINTGTLCNLSCANCYIESTPLNDRLVYITADEVTRYLDEIETNGLATHTIGFTGGEPFMNPDFLDMLETTLERGHHALVLTNAMRPMLRVKDRLSDIQSRLGERLILRVSLDHYTKLIHEAERGERSWQPTMDGLQFLSDNGFTIHVAARMFSGESEVALRQGFGRLFTSLSLSINPDDPVEMVIFPEMDETVDVPEITDACWGILCVHPDTVMCSGARMVVKRKGAERPTVVACTLLPYDVQFEFGETLSSAAGEVALNHPHCAKFCVLGGASCGG